MDTQQHLYIIMNWSVHLVGVFKEFIIHQKKFKIDKF